MGSFGEAEADRTLRERIAARDLRVTLIDDDPSLGEVVAVVAREALGPRVTVRQHLRAAEALADPALARVDIIVLDLRLPDGNGESVLDSLRRDAGTRDAAVLVLTADARWDKIARLLSTGADDYLFKPFDPRTLGRQLREMRQIRMKRLARAGRAGAEEGGSGHAGD